MKEVVLTPTFANALGNEAETLMKINDMLKNQTRIVQVLKLLRRGDKMHFIFRLAEGNLEELLRNETRPGKVWENHQHIPGRPICQNTLWDEAVGIMTALHAFQRPQQYQEWRGYHSDLKRIPRFL
jgi:hypothetical protein